MEQLLEDIDPPRDAVFDDLARELRDGVICPVLLGVATRANGVLRLLKALRHEAPTIEKTAARLKVGDGKDGVAYVFKTQHVAHGGKASYVRVFAGQFADGATLIAANGEAGRISAIMPVSLGNEGKRPAANPGDVVIFGKVEHAATGDTLGSGKTSPAALVQIKPHAAVLAAAIAATDRKDDVKLGQSLLRLGEEDPSLSIVSHAETHEVVLWGQGEMHLRVAIERLQDRFGVSVKQHPPVVGYRETIRRPVTGQRGRHKKQSGGHGQYGDVVLDIKPLARSEGIVFDEKVVGGAVPRNYIPAVEDGVRDALTRGPLGFPVVDVAVTLTDGSYHTVDSSDLAFRTAGRIGVSEALPQCQPVLLEPIHSIEIVCPTDATAKINAILSGRRGQILSFDTREGWPGWEAVRAMIPEAEIGNLIVEIRSATAGAGTFTTNFDHMAEISGRTADQIVAAHPAGRGLIVVEQCAACSSERGTGRDLFRRASHAR